MIAEANLSDLLVNHLFHSCPKERRKLCIDLHGTARSYWPARPAFWKASGQARHLQNPSCLYTDASRSLFIFADEIPGQADAEPFAAEPVARELRHSLRGSVWGRRKHGPHPAARRACLRTVPHGRQVGRA
jgi:hypothetical protein